MFTLAIGTVPSSNVPVQVLLPRRGIAAACPGALVRPLPRVLAVVAVQGGLLRPSIAAARPGALVRPLPRACMTILLKKQIVFPAYVFSWPRGLLEAFPYLPWLFAHTASASLHQSGATRLLLEHHQLGEQLRPLRLIRAPAAVASSFTH